MIAVDALQYPILSRASFEEMRQGGLGCVHVTAAYHEGIDGLLGVLSDWDRAFEAHGDLIAPARSAAEIEAVSASGRTAILLGLQTPAPFGADLGRVAHLHRLGIRISQLTYNVQSLCGAGWQEPVDGGLTLYGREILAEMERLGMLVDLSHAGDRTAMGIVEAASRPVAITHANPRTWRDTGRNVADDLIAAVSERGGVVGFSLYPHHLAAGSDCALDAFCAEVARTAERVGAHALGIGSDLCRGQPDRVVQWMRDGRWRRPSDPATFPAQPPWFRSAADWPNLRAGLRAAGFDGSEADRILGGNWIRLFGAAFEPG